MTEKVVLVTGFGPFGAHPVNASWEAVKLLPKYQTENVKIVIHKLPVVYDIVDEMIPTLWKNHQPTLVVHVGVSSITEKITLEGRANKGVYVKPDANNKISPTGNACPNVESQNTLETQFDLDDISNYLNENSNIKSSVSDNAGLYLCEYTYYTSLHIDPQRVLFVHVPTLDNPYSDAQLAEAIFLIIQRALKQSSNSIY